MLKISSPHLNYKFLFVAIFVLAYSHSASAEIWLTDQLTLKSDQRLLLSRQENNSQWRLVPEFTLIQNAFSHSEIQLGTKLDLQKDHSEAAINAFNLRTSLSPYWSVILGRQSTNYIQADLFLRSLSSHDEQYNNFNNSISYSQGIKATYRLGFIEQQFFIRQLKYSNQRNHQSFKQDDLSYHYQLSLGVPGYLAGPLNITLESQEDSQGSPVIRGMLGSALQLPIKIIRGDWQWAFQYASEFDQNKQTAWQTSLSWLGFIPQHKIGVLWGHTDESWFYSDDFKANSNHIELRYQWIKNQNLDLELSMNRITDNDALTNKKEVFQGQFTLGYHF